MKTNEESFAKSIKKLLACVWFTLACIAFASSAAYANVAGHVQFTSGDVQVINAAGQARAARKGDAINEGDTLTSAQKSSAQIRMQDGGMVAVRPDTRLKFDRFIFSGKQDGTEQSFFSLFKGGFRAVTGLIGQINKPSYRIATPAATIGIRGTDHETFMVASDSELAQVVRTGAYNKVNIGETYIATEKGTLFVLPNQMGFAGGMDQMPQLQPINTNVFTVAEAPAPEDKAEKKEEKEDQADSTESGDKQATGVRETAVVDATPPVQAPPPAPLPPAPPPPPPPLPPPPPPPIPETAAGGCVFDYTAQTVTCGGVVYSLEGATSAQAFANAAKQAAGTADFSLALSSGSATATRDSATTAVNGATGLSIDTALASSNLSSAQAAATTASSLATNASAALSANGAFADSTAAPANSAVQSNYSLLLAAKNSVQTAASAVTTDNTNLTNAKSAASSALTSANSSLATANTQLGNLSGAQTTLSDLISQNSTVLTGIVAPATLQEAVAVAQQAANLATSLQAAGDFSNAQIAMSVAQAASDIVTYALAANTAITDTNTYATTASSQASSAQSVASIGATDVGTTTSELANVNSYAATIAASAPIAAYNNPAIVGDFIGHAGMSVPVAGGFNDAFTPDTPLQPNTQYVLDGGGNLVEMRNAPFQVQSNTNGNVLTPSITGASGADIKWSGGTAADTFKLADNSIYAGRWVNPTITVTDNANTANVYTYSPAASLWAVLFPPPAGYVQSLGGTTTYTKAGNTTPVDAFGDLGVLNSASLAANFTSQLVDAAVNLTMSTGSMAGTFVVTANNMSIDTVGSVNPSGFSVPNAGALTTSCISGACAAGASGYSADIGGSFAGAAAASAGMSYNIWPTTALGSDPMTNSVQGLVAFTTATPPTALAALAFVQTDVSFEVSLSNYYYFYYYYSDHGGMTAAANVTPGANPPSFTSDYGGTYTIQLPGASGAVNGNATSFATTGIQFGRWTDVPTISQTSSYPFGQGAGYYYYGYGGASWAFAPEGYLDTPTTLSAATGGANPIGVFTYALNGATTPKDGVSGAAGTLDSMTLTADFTTQTLSAALQVSLGATTWTANTGTVNLSGATFPNYGLNVTSNAACAAPPCVSMGGSLGGAFTGQNYAGAIVNYNIYEYPLAGVMHTTNINGVAAMTRNGVAGNASVANGAAVPTGKSVVSDWWWGGVQTVDTVTASGGVLTGYGWDDGGGYTSSTTISCTTGCTGQAAPDTATGIQFGTWETGTRTHDYTAPYGGPAHWISGPGLDPIYLPEVLLGTMTYSLDGGTAPTNQSGLTGTLSSASLAVNFTSQTVNIALGLTGVNGHDWTANSTGTPLDWTNYSKNGFYAYSGQSLVVTMDGAMTGNGYISGQLTGSGLNGALFDYQLNASLDTFTTESVNGTVALVAATPADVATPYRLVGFSAFDPVAVINTNNINTGMVLEGGFNNVARVTEVAGNVTAFDSGFGSDYYYYTYNYNYRDSVRLDIGTATPSGLGTDPTTGISWGRWDGGSINITDRTTGATTPSSNIDASLHWIATPDMSAPVALPTTGTYSYVLAGGTAPTDNLGNVGTLNSATLSANFTAQTVNVGVEVGIAAATLNASGSNIPIQQRLGFDASTANLPGGSGLLTATCTGACGGAPVQAEITGAFTGATGAGAAMLYGFVSNGSVVNGVAAFHR